jgi:hypothetical protein
MILERGAQRFVVRGMRMMAMAAGVEDPGKIAMFGLPCQRRTVRFFQ